MYSVIAVTGLLISWGAQFRRLFCILFLFQVQRVIHYLRVTGWRSRQKTEIMTSGERTVQLNTELRGGTERVMTPTWMEFTFKAITLAELTMPTLMAVCGKHGVAITTHWRRWPWKWDQLASDLLNGSKNWNSFIMMAIKAITGYHVT